MAILNRTVFLVLGILAIAVFTVVTLLLITLRSSLADLDADLDNTSELTEPFKNLKSGDGVDYLARSNSYYAKNVLPENNMAVALVEQCELEDSVPAELERHLCRELGINESLKEGRFRSFKRWISEVQPGLTPVEKREYELRANYAMSYGWNDQQLPKVAQWLDQYQNELNEVTKSSKLPNFYMPVLGENLVEHWHPYFLPYRDVVRAFARRANRNRVSLKDEREFEGWLNELRVITRYSLGFRGPTSLHTIVPDATFSIAVTTMVQRILDGDMSEDQLMRLREFLRQQHFEDDFYSNYCNGEIYYGFDTLQKIVNGESGEPMSQLPRDVGIDVEDGDEYFLAAAVEVEKYCREYAQLLKIEDHFKRHQACKAFGDRLDAISEQMTTPESKAAFLLGGAKNKGVYVGRVLFSLVHGGAIELEVRAWTMTRVALTVTAIDLERYKLKYGDYPKNLQALVPEFRTDLPRDCEGGSPLVYEQNGGEDGFYKLYSIGFNCRDEDGILDSENGKDDIEFQTTGVKRLSIEEFLANDPRAAEYR